MNKWQKRVSGLGSGLLLGTTLLVTQGLATDLPMNTYVPPAPVEEDAEQFDWDRFYAGLVVGHASGNVDITTNAAPTFFDQSFALSGGFVGVTLGRNFLLGEDDEDTEEDERNIVLGIEGDIAWANMRAEDSDVLNGTTVRAQIDALATLRARIGIVMGDDRNFMPYLTGGLAVIHAEASLTGGVGQPLVTTSDWLWGYTIGGGLEVVLDEDITLKAEYLYTDVAGTLEINNIGGGGLDADFDFRANHLVRLGLNYHF